MSDAPTGRALRMRLELERLRVKHGLAPPQLRTLPLAEPAEGDVIVEGYATTPDVDATRQRLRVWSLSWPPFGLLPPLLYRHREQAGTLQELRWTPRGLWVRALVRHSEAKRCAGFSVGAAITKYRIEAADSPAYHAVIETGTLIEVSMSPAPCNARALVTARTPVLPASQFYGLAQEYVRCLQQLASLIRNGLPT